MERLVIWMPGDQRLQFRDQILSPAELQVAVDPPFQGEHLLVGEPCRGDPGERRVRHVGQSLAAPQDKPGAEQG